MCGEGGGGGELSGPLNCWDSLENRWYAVRHVFKMGRGEGILEPWRNFEYTASPAARWGFSTLSRVRSPFPALVGFVRIRDEFGNRRICVVPIAGIPLVGWFLVLNAVHFLRYHLWTPVVKRRRCLVLHCWFMFYTDVFISAAVLQETYLSRVTKKRRETFRHVYLTR